MFFSLSLFMARTVCYRWKLNRFLAASVTKHAFCTLKYRFRIQSIVGQSWNVNSLFLPLSLSQIWHTVGNTHLLNQSVLNFAGCEYIAKQHSLINRKEIEKKKIPTITTNTKEQKKLSVVFIASVATAEPHIYYITLLYV